MATTVYTIGHSNHSQEALFSLLGKHGIRTLVDVRSSPYSRYAFQFNREEIERAVGAAGIDYLFLGDALGGRPQDDEFYDAAGHVLYDRLARSAEFQRGLRQVIELADRRSVAVMCGEEDPADCHRRRLIGRVLVERGVRVVHLRGDGRAQDEAELARDERHKRTGGQKTLFDLEEPEPWRSTRSVLRARAPDSSSDSSEAPESAD